MNGTFKSNTKFSELFGNCTPEFNKFWPIKVHSSTEQITLSNNIGCSITVDASGVWNFKAPATIPKSSQEMLIGIVEKFIA